MSDAPPAYVYDEVFLGHRAPGLHPERPERLLAARDALGDAGVLANGARVAARAARREELLRVHAAGYLDELERRLPGRSGLLDADTYFSAGTWDAALAAAGGTIDLALGALAGRPRGFAAVRPPGHHAEPGRAMGFCLLNNAALAAAAARAAGAARVAVLDWDVHHGNGTQAAFWRDPSVLYLSVHQSPLYPGTGAAGEAGDGPGRGTTLNVPLPPGSGDEEYEAVFAEAFDPALRRFRPELVIVSAGFDALDADPLAAMRVSPSGFRRIAEIVRAACDALCGGRMIAVLEGGYDLEGLRASVAALLEVLALPHGEARPADPAFDVGGLVAPPARLAITSARAAWQAAAGAGWGA